MSDTETMQRSYTFEQIPSDGLTLEGYAAVFNSPTRIANWEGDFTETIAPGAFARAVRATPRPKVQFDHGQHPLLGSIPIAALESMKEDARGLYIKARLHDNWMTEPVRDAIASGAIDGMSFRFNVPKGGDEWDATRQNRTLTDVDVMELGPVVFPAYKDTEVSVRSQQLAEALQDPDIRKDLAIAFLIDPDQDIAGHDEPETRATDDVPPVEGDDDARTINDEPATPQVSSAPNPARVHALALEARLSRILQRSTLEPAGVSE